MSKKPTSQKSATLLGISVGSALAAGWLGSLFTAPAIPTWYAALEKPFFSPPNWLFAPVWTVLYLLMGVALFLILMVTKSQKQKKTAVGLYATQLVVNIAWSVAFFGFRSPELGLFVILVLDALVAATIKSFWPLSKTAALLLLPYMAWISFATLLNLAIVLLN